MGKERKGKAREGSEGMSNPSWTKILATALAILTLRV